MGVSLRLSNVFWEIGSAGFLNCFFSTITYHLEPGGSGTRVPHIYLLYGSGIEPGQADEAGRELETARRELSRLRPEQVIWDCDDLKARPPWEPNISPDVTDLSNYFVTSDGRDLFEVLLEALGESRDSGQPLSIG